MEFSFFFNITQYYIISDGKDLLWTTENLTKTDYQEIWKKTYLTSVVILKEINGWLDHNFLPPMIIGLKLHHLGNSLFR